MLGKKLFATKVGLSWKFSPYFERWARRYSFEIKCSWSVAEVFFEKKTLDDYDLVGFD
jgi:hypothetical protein